MALALQTIFTPLQDRSQPLEGIWLDRNWHLTSTPIWSCDLTASLAIAADRFPQPVPLLLWVRVFGATPQSPRTLTVRSPGHDDQTLTVRTSQPVVILTQTPVHDTGADHSPLFLVLDTISSPYAFNLSSDDRLLGVQIMSLATDRPVLEWPLDFTASDQAAPALGSGWANIDTGSGVWSTAEEAHFLLPGYLHRPGGDTLVISADTLPRPDDMVPLIVEVICHGKTVVSWEFLRESNDDPLQCPLPNWYDNTDYRIALRLSNLRSPKQLDINSDSRPLGLHLRRLEVTGQG